MPTVDVAGIASYSQARPTYTESVEVAVTLDRLSYYHERSTGQVGINDVPDVSEGAKFGGCAVGSSRPGRPSGSHASPKSTCNERFHPNPAFAPTDHERRILSSSERQGLMGARAQCGRRFAPR
eukprot:2224786-Pleurochrysis_carterae.AAC.1